MKARLKYKNKKTEPLPLENIQVAEQSRDNTTDLATIRARYTNEADFRNAWEGRIGIYGNLWGEITFDQRKK
jgi:hypothetical protein